MGMNKLFTTAVVVCILTAVFVAAFSGHMAEKTEPQDPQPSPTPGLCHMEKDSDGFPFCTGSCTDGKTCGGNSHFCQCV